MPTKKKNIFKGEKTLLDYFYYVMKNKNGCRQLCLKLLNKLVGSEFKEEAIEFGEIGFYIKSETKDKIYYTFSCEHVGSDTKMVLIKREEPDKYIDANYIFVDMHSKFTIRFIYKLIKDLTVFND